MKSGEDTILGSGSVLLKRRNQCCRRLVLREKERNGAMLGKRNQESFVFGLIE